MTKPASHALRIEPVGGSRWAWAACVLAICLFMTGLVGPRAAEAAISGCSVTSSGIVFSPYDTVTKTSVDGVGTITVSCTGSGTENLSLNLAGGNAGSCTTRQMRRGTASLNYQIFREASASSAWCEGGSRLDITLNFASGATQTASYTMYGQVGSGQNPTFGSYTDSLSVVLKRGGGTLASTTASISGSVSPICSVSAGSLGFGTYSAAAATLGVASISVNCSNGGAYQVSLESGQYSTGSTRRMAGPGGNFLNYELYSNSGRSIAWGNGTAFGGQVSGTGSGSAQSLVVYGRIPASQLSTPGSYSDSVIVTVEY
jgi:spore coat protein U-like protein